MKKLQDWRALQKGGIYNRVYIGENEEFAKINGKNTFIVLETEPAFQYQILFDQFGSVYSDELRSNIITMPNPEVVLREFDLYEPENKNEWFIKSLKMTSLVDALEAKLINISDIKNVQGSTKGFAATSGEKLEPLGIEYNFRIEGTPENPLLQSVFIVWKNPKELLKDFSQYGVIIKL